MQAVSRSCVAPGHYFGTQAAHGPRLARFSLASRPCNPRPRTIVHAERFDETAASVRRLLDRDRKDTALEDLDFLGSLAQEEESGEGGETPTPAPSSQPRPEPNPAMRDSAAARSFLSPSSYSPGDDFLGPSSDQGRPEPSLEMRPLEPPSTKPWWQGITNIQIFIAFSFTTIIGLMFATFWVAVRSGAVHFND
ncbi:hypothetical protein ACKKBF_B31645 [Auxenochlorella protothecoides x Auxenochlorella symbiontica]